MSGEGPRSEKIDQYTRSDELISSIHKKHFEVTFLSYEYMFDCLRLFLPIWPRSRY